VKKLKREKRRRGAFRKKKRDAKVYGKKTVEDKEGKPSAVTRSETIWPEVDTKY